MGSMEIQLAHLKENNDTAQAEIVRLKGHNSLLLETLQEKEDATEKAQEAIAEVIDDIGESLLLLRPRNDRSPQCPGIRATVGQPGKKKG